MSRGIEYPLLHEMIAYPAQTPSVWRLMPDLIVAKDRGVQGEHWHQKTNLFQVDEARELCFLTIHLGIGDSDLQTPNCLVGHS